MATNNGNGFPQDVKPAWGGPLLAWLNVIRRLQSVGRQKNEGYAVLTIRVLVNADGSPVTWSEPDVTKLEPKESGDIPDVLALLARTR